MGGPVGDVSLREEESGWSQGVAGLSYTSTVHQLTQIVCTKLYYKVANFREFLDNSTSKRSRGLCNHCYVSTQGDKQIARLEGLQRNQEVLMKSLGDVLYSSRG